jgi:hypothetical protein
MEVGLGPLGAVVPMKKEICFKEADLNIAPTKFMQVHIICLHEGVC